MAFFDNLNELREKASEAAQTAAKKTKKLAEIAKANVSIYSEEDKIKKAEAELGKLYYRDYAVGEEMDTAEYLPWCKKIDEAKQTIADLRDYIEELKAEQVEMIVDEEVEVVDADIVTEEDFVDLDSAEAEEEPEMEIEIIVNEAPAEEESKEE